MTKKNYFIIGTVMLISLFLSCENEEETEKLFVGKAYIGQSIPVDTKFTYSSGDYSSWISFIDKNSYNWGQKNSDGEMTMVVPCEYDKVTGEFSDSMVAGFGDIEYGAWQYFPTSFYIEELGNLYLLTFNSQNDTNLVFPRTVAEKTAGDPGTMEGTYKSVFKSCGWITMPDGTAESIIEAEVNYTYAADTFSGTFTTRLTGESTLEIPEYDIEIGTIDETETISFSGTWTYNEADSTITETMIEPEHGTHTYKPYWVTYNNKLYLVTSLTRAYIKE